MKKYAITFIAFVTINLTFGQETTQTIPNPTSGFLLMFEKNDIIYLDMSFEEASKFVVSAGTTSP